MLKYKHRPPLVIDLTGIPGDKGPPPGGIYTHATNHGLCDSRPVARTHAELADARSGDATDDGLSLRMAMAGNVRFNYP